VSVLTPGDMAPRLQQVRVTELLANAPPALLWLAEKGSNRERLFIAEYEPKGGAKAVLRDFNLWFQNLKTLSANIIPILDSRYIHEERSYLVFEAPGGQSVKRALESGQNTMPSFEFLHELLEILDQFTRSLPGSSHGWIRPETVMVFPDGRLLLGPPSFAPGAVPNPQSDLRDCAAIAAQWAGISLRQSDADVEQRKELQKLDDWALASTLEWMLLCKDRVPPSAGAVTTFLREASAVRKGEPGKDAAAALNTLKGLYQRSGSAIVKREIENTEARIPKTPPATPPPPQPRQDVKPAPEGEARSDAKPEIPEIPVAPAPRPPLPTPEIKPEPQPVFAPEPAPPPPVLPPPPPKKSRWIWIGALALGVIFGIYYYVSGAPLRELDDYLAKKMIVNTNGPSAYAVYQKAVREKGPDSSLVKSMNQKALPVLQNASKQAFDSWYKESELSKPAEQRPAGETAITTWDEMVQLQEWLNSIQKHSLSSAQYEYALGMAAYGRRNWNEARERFENALKTQPNWSLALNGVGKAYYGLQQYDLAEKYYRSATEADPSWCFPHVNLGALFDHLRNFEASEREYLQAIKLYPSRPTFHYYLATLYYAHSDKRNKQHWSAACSEFKASLISSSGKSLSPNEARLADLRRKIVCQEQ
jgi:tetratricopeptide (TPR) repeat protein